MSFKNANKNKVKAKAFDRKLIRFLSEIGVPKTDFSCNYLTYVAPKSFYFIDVGSCHNGCGRS